MGSGSGWGLGARPRAGASTSTSMSSSRQKAGWLRSSMETACKGGTALREAVRAARGCEGGEELRGAVRPAGGAHTRCACGADAARTLHTRSAHANLAVYT